MTTDELVYYYRPMPKSADCSDSIAPQPNRFQDDVNSVFVIAMLRSAGTVTIISRSNAPTTFQLAAGIHYHGTSDVQGQAQPESPQSGSA
ncbi:hypothetical protein DFH08DRAFT_950184 [Mycena albidolilacea]|uniref:Uncharacterized protein n=1 Tax=Mycena albidolilacea TaxID=1033008 RepID=A0AAD7APJ8_9AGAR|nr:hypothetical protein DFH08DRAFT_950184 [Mycena albidolilacea]